MSTRLVTEMSHLYKDPRPCHWCTYTTKHRSHWAQHAKVCKARPVASDPEKDQLRERVQSLELQLVNAQRQSEEQLAAKDRQIDELIRLAKKPRTQNQSYNVNQQINVFGKESLAHLTEAKFQELLSDPDTSVARLVTLKHSVEQNRNVRVPNVREKWVQVLKQDDDGTRRWESVPKEDILCEMVETNAMLLEGEADESTVPGARYSQWHERLLQSQYQRHGMFREQMDRVHQTLVESTRR